MIYLWWDSLKTSLDTSHENLRSIGLCLNRSHLLGVRFEVAESPKVGHINLATWLGRPVDYARFASWQAEFACLGIPKLVGLLLTLNRPTFLCSSTLEGIIEFQVSIFSILLFIQLYKFISCSTIFPSHQTNSQFEWLACVLLLYLAWSCDHCFQFRRLLVLSLVSYWFEYFVVCWSPPRIFSHCLS